MGSESELRSKIRADLPAEVFLKKPMRALLVIPLGGTIVLGSVILVAFPLPWYVALLSSLLIGNFYASLMVLAHEIGHGATVHSCRIQDLCLYLACWMYWISPHLWRIWHNQIHHPYTNVEGRDPDSFGTLEEFLHHSSLVQFSVKFAPGSGHWFSVFSLFFFFTGLAQSVLWMQSKRVPGFERLRRRRAILESALMAASWVILCIMLGPRASFFVVIIPILMANFVLMSYGFTNHALRPLTDTRDTLSTTMSVTTFRFLDFIHFNNSYHVEHHLFPAVCSSYYPLIRQSLRRHAGDRYMSPPHWWALLVLFRTPRYYKDAQTLIEPLSGRIVKIVDVETMLVEMMT